MNNTKKQEIKNRLKHKMTLKRLESVYCRLKPSKIHGVGIFAIKDIPKGINPFKDSYLGQDGIVLNKKNMDYQKLDDKYKKLLEDYHPTLGNNIQYIPAFPNQISWTDFINYVYDEQANLELLENGKWNTKRLIKSGEELLENPNELFNPNGSHKIYRVKNGLYRNIV